MHVVTTVLHVLSGFHLAGIEQLALQLVRHAPSEVDLELLNIDALIQDFRESFEAVARDRTLKIYDWPKRDGLVLALCTFRHCRRQRPRSVMIYPCNRRLLWVALGARLAGVKNIGVHYANPPLSLRQHLQWLAVLGCFVLLGVQVMPCSAALLQASGTLIRALPLCRPIPNGVDVASISARAATARHQRLINDPFTVLMTARLDEIKDQATLIAAFAKFHRHVPHSRLLLAGDGPLRHDLEQHAREAGLDPAAIFLGRRSDIPELLGQADLFAYSTTSAEGAPFALIEAVAAGLPILSTAVAACPEILDSGRAGMLLPSAAVDLWAEALMELWADPGRRARLAAAARERAEAFDVRTTAATVYGQLLDGHEVAAAIDR